MSLLTNQHDIEEFMSGVEVADYSAPTTQGINQPQNQGPAPTEQSWGLYNSDEGSIWDTAKARISAQFESMIAANVEDPDRSRYANKRFVDQYKDWENKNEQLGTAGQVAAGITSYAPSIAAGMIPGVGLAAGAGAMGIQSTADALMSQYEEGQEFNMGKASAAGAASAITDLALGGIGGKLLKAPGASNLTRQAQTVAIEDAGSAVASTVYENLASGRDWNENTATAALMGGAAGAGVRGSFSGISKALEIPFNKGGEGAAKNVGNLERSTGFETNSEIATSYVDLENAKAGVRERMNTVQDIDSPDFNTNISEYNTLAEKGAAQRAVVKFSTMAPDLHMIPEGLNVNMKNYNGEEFNVGEAMFGLSRGEMERSKVRMGDIRETMFKTQRGEAEAGLTEEAFHAKMSESYNKKFQAANGHLDKNIFDLREKYRVLKEQGAPASILENYRLAEMYMKNYREAFNSSIKTPSKASDNDELVRDISKRLNESLIKIGEDVNMKGFDGSKGDFDSYSDYLVGKMLHESAVKQVPSFVFGAPDALKKKQTGGSSPTVLGAAKKVVGSLVGVPAAKGAVNLGRRQIQARAMKKVQDRAAEIKARADRVQEELSSGNTQGAKEASVDALKDQGIEVPNTPTKVEPSPAVEPAVEAPVSPVESIPVRSKADAKTRPAPRQKEVEEPIEAPVVETKITPEAQAPKSPKESRKAKRDKARAERDAKRQAEQARIAEELQESTQAERAAAKVARAPKVKEEPQVEEPVVEMPKPKTEAKAARTPKQKASPETVEQIKEELKNPEAKAPQASPETVKEIREEIASTVQAKSRTKPATKKAEEPAQEAPQKAPQEPLGRKQPTRTQEEEKPVEEPTEAPVKEEPETPKEEPKKTDYARSVKAPLQKLIEEPISRRDPKLYNEMIIKKEHAKEDLKFFNKMVKTTKGYTEEDIARVIHDAGGMRDLRAAAKDAGMSDDAYMKYLLNDLETLRKQEAALKVSEMKELTQKVTKKPEEPTPKTKSVDERKEFSDEMEVRGVHPDDQKVVESAIDNGLSIKNARIRAQTLTKARKESMEKELRDMEDSMKEHNRVLEQKGKRTQVDEYLKGMNAEGIPEIDEMVSKVFKHNKNVTDNQIKGLLDNIDSFLDKELKRYKSLTRGMSKADPRMPEYEAAGLIYQNAQKVLNSNRSKVDKKYNEAERMQREEAMEHQRIQSDYDKLFREADARDANITKVSRQKEEMTDELLARGFDEDSVNEHIKRTFYKRDTSPLSEKEMRSNMLGFIDQVEDAQRTAVERKKRAVQKVVESSDDATLQDMAREVTLDPEVGSSLDDSADIMAMAKALTEEMSKRGLKKEATRLEAFNEAILEGQLNKMKYPDNPELWVPANVLKTIQSTYGTGTGSHAGGMWTTIKMVVTGSTKGKEDFGTLERSKMEALQRKMDRQEEGKLLTGQDDISVK